MDMRAVLIKMNLEADYVFLSVPFGAPVIDIFCPLFDFRTSLEMAVVCSLVQIYGLGPLFLEFIYKFIVHELPPPFEDSLYKQRES